MDETTRPPQVISGYVAADLVREMCHEAKHQLDSFNRTPVTCDHCTKVIRRLRELHRDNPPPPLPVLVHFVVAPDGGFQGVHLDQARANDHARHIGGLVVSMPAASDYRNQDSDSQDQP